MATITKDEVYSYLADSVKPQLKALTDAVRDANNALSAASGEQGASEVVNTKITELKDDMLSGTVIPAKAANAESLEGKSVDDIVELAKEQTLLSVDSTAVLDDNDEIGSNLKTYSSAKIKELMALNVELDDTKPSDRTTYSSKKIDELLATSVGGVSINDDAPSSNEVYSSSKVDALIAAAALDGVSEEQIRELIAQNGSIDENKVRELIAANPSIDENRVGELIAAAIAIAVADKVTEARVSELIAAASLAGGNIDEEKLKTLIASEIAKNPSIDENRVRELIAANTLKINDDSASSSEVYSSQKIQTLLAGAGGNMDEESIKEMIAEALGTAKTEYSGNGSPDIQSNLSTANNGALYTDKGTNDIYIKNNGSWQKINTDVATFSGSGRPSNEDGRALGTIYKDTSTNDIYVKAFINGKNVYKKIKDGIAISDDVVLIPDDAEADAVFGDIGGYGAGVAYLPQSAAKVGLSPLSGASEKSNDNFGNFEDEFGNIFVCIPRMYYKADGDNRNNDKNAMFFNKPNIYLSYAPKDGYEPFYAFKKSDGSYVNCVFVSKYLMGLSNGRTISARGQDMLTSTSGTDMAKYNGLGQISGLTSNNAGFFDAAKKMNSHTTLHYAALRFVYYMVAEAHTQEAARIYGGIAKVPSAICAYLDKQPYFPKGCNTNLGDHADTSVKYTQGTKSYSGMGRTGSATNQAKTTFNGQMCGIADMGGLAYEVDAGYINNDGTTYALKGIDLLKNMTSSSYSNVSNYTALNLANRRDTSAVYCGNGENQIFSLRDSKSSANAMLCDNFLIPLSNGMSSSGTDAYGKDSNYPLTKGGAPVFGGYCSSAAQCGLLFMYGGAWASGNQNYSARTIVVP